MWWVGVGVVHQRISWEVSIYMSEEFQKALGSKDNLWIHVFHHRGEDT